MMQVCRVFLVLMYATVGLANMCILDHADIDVTMDDFDPARRACVRRKIEYENDPETGLRVVGDQDTCGVTVQCVDNVLRFSGFGTTKDFLSNCGYADVKFVFGEFMIDCKPSLMLK